MAQRKTTELDRLLQEVATDVVEACSVDSIMLKQNRIRGDPNYVQMPISLLPTPYPFDMYKEAFGYQQAMG